MFTFDDRYEAFDTTPVSNLFITDYLPGCDGDQLKVYLCGLMRCHYPRQDFAMEDLAKALEMDVKDVQAAMRHLEFEGLVERTSDKPPAFRFRHPASIHSGNENDGVYERFIEDLYNAFGGRRDLHGYEKRKAWEWVSVQGLPQEVVMVLVKHLIKTQGRDFRFLGKETRRVVNLLIEENARTTEEAITVLARDEEIDAGARAVIRRFRQRRLPSEDELNLYKKWRREWNFSDAEILDACAETTKVSNPNFGYLDAILGGIRQRSASPKEDREQQALVREMLKALGVKGIGVNEGTRAAYRQMAELYPHEIILMAARELSTRQNNGIDVLISMLESWKKKGIQTAEQAQAHVAAFNRENDLILRLNSLWESDLVRIGDTSRAKVRTWLTEWGFSPEIILFCASFAGVNEKKSPMAYLDSILKSYHDKGLTTEAEIAAEHEHWAAEHSAVPSSGAHRMASKAISQLQYEQREYEERKPGELPAWLREMMEEEQHAN